MRQKGGDGGEGEWRQVRQKRSKAREAQSQSVRQKKGAEVFGDVLALVAIPVEISARSWLVIRIRESAGRTSDDVRTVSRCVLHCHAPRLAMTPQTKRVGTTPVWDDWDVLLMRANGRFLLLRFHCTYAPMRINKYKTKRLRKRTHLAHWQCTDSYGIQLSQGW